VLGWWQHVADMLTSWRAKGGGSWLLRCELMAAFFTLVLLVLLELLRSSIWFTCVVGCL
jgi:hypothetical protein